MSIEPQQLEMFVASQFAESLGGSTQDYFCLGIKNTDELGRKDKENNSGYAHNNHVHTRGCPGSFKSALGTEGAQVLTDQCRRGIS